MCSCCRRGSRDTSLKSWRSLPAGLVLLLTATLLPLTLNNSGMLTPRGVGQLVQHIRARRLVAQLPIRDVRLGLANHLRQFVLTQTGGLGKIRVGPGKNPCGVRAAILRFSLDFRLEQFDSESVVLCRQERKGSRDW
jgi:hypothetical protein